MFPVNSIFKKNCKQYNNAERIDFFSILATLPHCADKRILYPLQKYKQHFFTGGIYNVELRLLRDSSPTNKQSCVLSFLLLFGKLVVYVISGCTESRYILWFSSWYSTTNILTMTSITATRGWIWLALRAH